MRGVLATSAWRDLRAHGCDSHPACAESGVERSEMRLPVCGSCSGAARSDVCMSHMCAQLSFDGVRERASVDA